MNVNLKHKGCSTIADAIPFSVIRSNSVFFFLGGACKKFPVRNLLTVEFFIIGQPGPHPLIPSPERRGGRYELRWVYPKVDIPLKSEIHPY